MLFYAVRCMKWLIHTCLFQVANGLYYNAPMCLTILQHLGVTSEIFQTWFQMLYAVKKSGKPLHFVRYRLILVVVQRWMSYVCFFVVRGFRVTGPFTPLSGSGLVWGALCENELAADITRTVGLFREHDKKVCILGLASLLAVPSVAMPPELQTGLDQVFRALLKLLVAYKEQREGGRAVVVTCPVVS